MNNLNANYEGILEALRKISKEKLLSYQRRQPKFNDLELISLSLTAQYMEINSENDLFRKLSHTTRSGICKEEAYAFLDKDYGTAQSSSYYGYKLHAVFPLNNVFQSIDLSPASVHDINYLRGIKVQINDCTLNW